MTGKVYSLFGANGAIMEEIPPVPELPLYCELVCYGYAMSEGPAAIIGPKGPRGQKAVTLSEYSEPHFFYMDNHDRPLSKKFGIGNYYYDDLRTVDPERVQLAIQKAEERERKLERMKNEAAEESRQAVERGKQLFADHMPAGALGVIVADCMQDDSDPMTDYFASHSERTIILAWTFKKRDDFKEMRKAAAACPLPEVNKFGTAPTVDHNGSEKTEENKDWWHPEDEHRENYSMGAGNYLGDYKRSGIKITKRMFNPEKIGDSYYDAAGRPDGFFAFKSEQQPKSREVKEASQEAANAPSEAGTVQIIDYSEKAIAVIGDTKPIKEKLKAAGGSFNPRLTCGPGWIFSKKRLEDLKTILTA